MRRLIAVFLFAALVAAACGSPSSSTTTASPVAASGSVAPATAADSALDKLVTDAKKEGSVVLYCAPVVDVCQRVSEQFKAAYGITVTVTGGMQTGPLTERLKQEIAAGQLRADTIVSSDPIYMKDLYQKGELQSLEGLPAWNAYPAEWRIPAYVPTAVNFAQVLLYNTKNVTGKDIPTKWTDLLDPKWKGRIGFPNPRSGVTIVTFYATLIDSQGKDFIEKLGKQELQIFDSTTQSAQLVAAGALDFAFSVGHAVPPLKKAGAPVEQAYVPPTPLLAIQASATKKGPHPSAGLLLAHWLLTPTGQCALACNQTYVSVLPGIATTLPAPDKYVKYEDEVIIKRVDEVVQLFNQYIRR
jgi:iron(III) transport system substrate-binding protein